MAASRPVKLRRGNGSPAKSTTGRGCWTGAAGQSRAGGIAALLEAPVDMSWRFDMGTLLETLTEVSRHLDIADLRAVKFSFPRHHVQGDPRDRDMHGASHAAPTTEFRLD